jgi:hypothetical protein
VSCSSDSISNPYGVYESNTKEIVTITLQDDGKYIICVKSECSESTYEKFKSDSFFILIDFYLTKGGAIIERSSHLNQSDSFFDFMKNERLKKVRANDLSLSIAFSDNGFHRIWIGKKEHKSSVHFIKTANLQGHP